MPDGPMIANKQYDISFKKDQFKTWVKNRTEKIFVSMKRAKHAM